MNGVGVAPGASIEFERLTLSISIKFRAVTERSFPVLQYNLLSKYLG